jgi:hypothetical protein
MAQTNPDDCGQRMPWSFSATQSLHARAMPGNSPESA